MKVNYNTNTYLIHWETVPFIPDHGSPSREISETACVIRKVLSGGEIVHVTTGTVREHSEDVSDRVIARKIALTKALRGTFDDKGERTAFWDEYKATARLTKRTERSKNRVIREQIEVLKKKVLEMVALTEKEYSGVTGNPTGNFLKKR